MYIADKFKDTHESQMWVPEMEFVYGLFIINIAYSTAMRKIPMVLVVASIAVASIAIAAASIAGLNVAQVVYAKTVTSGTCPCGSGNPHAAESDNPNPPLIPKGKS